ncbi:MAG: lipase family alpha/beta hydrolase [Oscillospiraceae bacterium]
MVYFIWISDVSAKDIIINSIVAVIAEFILFWDGTIRLYTTSVQMGIKWRVVGLICGMIPILNIFVLIKTIKIADEEYMFECDKFELDNSRATSEICKTKYPLLLVHGVFFRDFKYLNYWGRIPNALKTNGAVIYYGSQQSAASVASCAQELCDKIKEIVDETGCGKVNIIAHSKGGLDARYALSCLGADKYVASLTTINTPHRGCQFADYLLDKASDSLRNSVSSKYNSALKVLGDTNPDFISAVTDLTAKNCKELNSICQDAPDVYYQSVGSKVNKAVNGKFPLNLSYHLVKYFDGDNDGLVSVDSMKWGENFIFLASNGKRGISHGDVIDLNRENIKGFDVREFYINLVSDLKNKGF